MCTCYGELSIDSGMEFADRWKVKAVIMLQFVAAW